jgi:ACS family D-galactonate transporter-like MFS transporter
LVGGQISDYLLKAGRSANFARKLPAAGGLILAAFVPLANLVPAGQDGLVILIMSIAFFGQGASNLGWTIISDIAPKQMIGLTAGIFNLVTNLAGILIPLIIGIILQVTQSYDWSLLFIGALPLLGAAIYVFVMGDIRRLEIA